MGCCREGVTLLYIDGVYYLVIEIYLTSAKCWMVECIYNDQVKHFNIADKDIKLIMHSNQYSIHKFLLSNICQSCSGTRAIAWHYIFFEKCMTCQGRTGIVWSGTGLVAPSCRKVLVCASAKSQVPLPLTPVWHTSAKNIKTKTKRRRKATVGATDRQQDRLYCSWWMEKSLRLLWVSLNMVCNMRAQPAITPCAHNRSTVEVAQAGTWPSCRQGYSRVQGTDCVPSPTSCRLEEDT